MDDVGITRNERYILVKPCKTLKKVGTIYEVGDFNGGCIIFRNVNTKVAVMALPLKDFNMIKECFKRVDYSKMKSGWTEWTRFNPQVVGIWFDYYSDLVNAEIYYKTNRHKTFVKIKIPAVDGVQTIGRASCNYKFDEKFDLTTGFNLALIRALIKYRKEYCINRDNDVLKTLEVVEKKFIEYINKKSADN